MALGRCAPSLIEVVGFAPLGDPMEIRLQDYRLSLRRSEAAGVQVRLVTEIE